MILDKDFKEFIELLIKHKVKYLIVGGFAVGVHGHPRYTGDIDIWLDVSENNGEKMMIVLREFGFTSLGLSKEDFLKPDRVIQLGYNPYRIDLLTGISGVKFVDAYKNKVQIELSGLLLDFIGYDELVKNKKVSGRSRDLDDIDNLKE